MARGLGRIGRQNARIRSIFALLWLLAGLALFTGSASADPSPAFYSGSASCNNDVATVAGPTVTSAISDVVVRIQASSNFVPASGANDPLEPSDVQWDDLGAVAVGSDPSFSVYCVSGSVNVSFFDAPTAPTSYTGATTPGDFGLDDSTLVFVVPSDDYYEAIVDVTQGAIQLNCTNGNGIFTSTGICDLGSLSSSDYEISDNDIAVSALDGPQAQWTITIEPIPVALSAVSASPTSGFTGSPTTISYTVSGNGSVTAGVYNSSNELVDDLASNLAVSQGKHSLTWGGTGAGGSPLPAGVYTIQLSSTDGEGNQSTQSVSFTIEPVTVSNLAASTSSPYVGGSEAVSYKLNGAASVTATVTNSAGGVVATLLSSSSQSKGSHSLKWNEQTSVGKAVAAGTYKLTVLSTDAGGDNSTASVATALKAYEAHTGFKPAEQVEPTVINISGHDDRAYLGGSGKHATLRNPSLKSLGRITWTTWGTQPTATGVLWLAKKAGSYSAFPVKFVLFAPNDGVFTKVSITFTGRRPSGTPKTVTLHW